MLYDSAYASEIKAWLASKLEPICDADPDVLADYVLALLKHDDDAVKLAQTLNDQLSDFLADNTISFSQETVEMLQQRSYLPASAPAEPPSPSAMDTSSSRKRGRPEGREDGDTSMTKSLRSGDGQQGDGAQNDAWANRRIGSGSTRGGRGGGGGGRMGNVSPIGDRQQQPGGRVTLPEGMCRDFHLRGFCSRGDSCKYQHLPTNGQPWGMPQPGAFPMPGSVPGSVPMPTPPQAGGEDAEMSNGALSVNNGLPDQPNPVMMPFPFPGMPGMPGMPGLPPMPGMDFGIFANGDGGRGRGRGQGSGPGRGGRGMNGQFRSTRRSQTTLVIENVPSENLDLMQVNERFKRFGTITNIQIDKAGRKALVSYSTADEARRAHSDPDVIFGSRFVKVYFQALDDQPSSDGAHSPGQNAGARGPSASSSASRSGRGGTPGWGGKGSGRQPVITAADVKMLSADAKAKQSAVATMLEEQKLLMSGITMLDGDAKKKAMSRLRELATTIPLATQQAKEAAEKVQNVGPVTPIPESSKALMEKAKKRQLDRELDAMAASGVGASMAVDGEEGGTGASEDGASTEELKAKLLSLKAEAAALGIDASGATGGRGRGRSGRFLTRGAYRGRGGAACGFQRGFANLDNRPTKLLVDLTTEGGDAIDGEKREKVIAWFKNFGEFENIEEGDSGASSKLVIKWKNRHEGDKAVWSGGNIPDVGKVKMHWAAVAVSSPASAAGTETTSPATAANGDQTSFAMTAV
ncbi:hypothetical protein K437DRAFT_296772 [Tilletiaria anomala UBC 951]|uniref:C3H1-type domain-containing protein n=1 Tax=Tilletiaria anomala (strain ATCC 24038 / CBS 436.72 / UBC 951) TaxID=1037660 RepID=A0A066V4A0_TILAU|nr:uncharacterized protein K437DRAFT_296772 [Tilletiaria anomala UBC 951]KDN36547.1 hypothetical protein K437DRAFT_296772 [Tilletiaria anomala UBC 951]